MRKTRVAALVIAAAIMAGALSQLPASPFAHNNYPQRPPSAPTADPSTSVPGANPSTSVPGADPSISAPTADPPASAAGTGSQKRTAPNSAVQPANPADPGNTELQTPPQTPHPNAAPGQGNPAITYPTRGTTTLTTLPANPTTIGQTGRIYTFQIAIEGGIKGIDPPQFARFVRETYGAPQGWTSDGKRRFRQVGPGQAADFRLMLVTPATRDTYCGGSFDQYTSCRIGDRVVLNVARWARGIPNYGADLATYRQYMLNHETGHRLGNAHELCPGPGQPAPVMQQQTLGLHGCTAYAWPLRNGRRYEGQLGKYDDPTPVS
ncbi:DUF3152 domain-containing protein [Kribbella sp. CA-293567]|uniref:DUF3152 domain-containing protein n=1 Tax=Kribbella sp. CA-293567 TaxID=3002436 RepID=UPI0022DD2995|nr:DUF3152 domain-containing protein [Kribbella sp. CA-293567]WBQ05631.1 DUF3152 domain-containing protein [Kribbella sp. CA-293567]